MRISLVIPLCNDLKIVDCLNSINEDVEVIIVLNRPTEQIREIIGRYENLKVVEINENNLAKAYNCGISNAKFANILLMDSDCIFDPNCISKLFEGLAYSKLSKGMVIFKHNNLLSKIVAKHREFTTTDFCNAYSPPLLINKSIINDIGYYFNEKLLWEEDLDFNNRVQKAKLKIYYNRSAIVYHSNLSIISDLKSAWRYGKGHAIGILENIFIKSEPFKDYITKLNYLLKEKGVLTMIYSIIWNLVYELSILYHFKKIGC